MGFDIEDAGPPSRCHINTGGWELEGQRLRGVPYVTSLVNCPYTHVAELRTIGLPLFCTLSEHLPSLGGPIRLIIEVSSAPCLRQITLLSYRLSSDLQVPQGSNALSRLTAL